MSRGRILKGRSLGPGTALGTAYRPGAGGTGFYHIQIEAGEEGEEKRRLEQALEASRSQLARLRQRLEERVGSEQSCIIDAHGLILDDARFLQEIGERIDRRQSAERAVQETAEAWLALYRSLKDPFFRQRGSDLQDVAERLAANLGALKPLGRQDLPEDLILADRRLSLLTLVEVGLDRIKGLVVQSAGHASHLAIIARSCGIPLVAGIEGLTQAIRSGDELAVDGTSGLVYVHPDSIVRERFESTAREEALRSRRLQGDPRPCRTHDGVRIRLLANTEVVGDVESGLRLGAEGVGLFRSEALFLEDCQRPVPEDVQFRRYRALARQLDGRIGIVRTLDIGDEDHPYFTRLAGGSRPLLGLRGIRLSLKFPELFRAQVHAILRAKSEGDLKIVLPMVSTVDEIIQARSLIGEAEAERGDSGGPIEVGIMIEVPAAVWNLEALAAHFDFALVGSNDLMQFTLAVGRAEEEVSDLYDPYHPAVIRSLSWVADVLRRYGKTGIVCGEVAADSEYAPLLLAMGFRTLSMSPQAIPLLKERIRGLELKDLDGAVDELLSLATAEEIRRRWTTLATSASAASKIAIGSP